MAMGFDSEHRQNIVYCGRDYCLYAFGNSLFYSQISTGTSSALGLASAGGVQCVCSTPDQKYIAVGCSGTEGGEIHVYEVVTKDIPDVQKSRLEEANLYLRITSSLALKHLSVTKTGMPGGLETMQFSPHAQQLAAVTTQPTS